MMVELRLLLLLAILNVLIMVMMVLALVVSRAGGIVTGNTGICAAIVASIATGCAVSVTVQISHLRLRVVLLRLLRLARRWTRWLLVRLARATVRLIGLLLDPVQVVDR